VTPESSRWCTFFQLSPLANGGMVYPQIKILSPLLQIMVRTHVVPHLLDFIFCGRQKMRFSRIKNCSDCPLDPTRTEDFKFQKSVKSITKRINRIRPYDFYYANEGCYLPTQKNKSFWIWLIHLKDLTQKNNLLMN